MTLDGNFKTWALSYSGCDGGDAGAPNKRSLWLCGIEWGGGHSPEELGKVLVEDVSTPPDGYSTWQDNLAWIYNRQAMKLLAAIHGLGVGEYRKFAEAFQPFVKGGSGYFKLNLYPIAFRNTSGEHWAEAFSKITGFKSKEEYLSWCNANRLPQIRSWANKHQPKAVICLGKTLQDSFALAFSVDPGAWRVEVIGERELRWSVNPDGTVVFVLPFMVNRNGLTRNVTIESFGRRIAQILQESPGN